MSRIDLRAIDLNLLVVLDVLLEERNVTRAARRLGRTQSAVSHALGRLRDVLQDPLLVRVGGAMRPTSRAVRLAPEVSRLLRAIERTLAEPSGFDPGASSRVFSLAAPDFGAAALPAILVDMARTAPRSSVELVPAGRGTFGDVAAGRHDLGLTPMPASRPEGLSVERAAILGWAVFARKRHPAIRKWGLAAWSRYPHVRIRTASDAESPVDRAAREAGVERPAGPFLPHFMLAPAILAATDCLLTVPAPALAAVADRFGLVALPCPVRMPPVELALVWSVSQERDPASVWFRGVVRRAIAEAFRR